MSWTLVAVFSPSVVSTVSHKSIGLYYLLTVLVMGVLGSLASVMLRIELDSKSCNLVVLSNSGMYNSITTLHGLVLIFFTVMPSMIGGVGNTLCPIILGSPEVAYPRLNLSSLVGLLLSFIVLCYSTIVEYGYSNGVGWTLYTPLRSSSTSLGTVSISILLTVLIG